MNYLPFCGYWFYGASNSTERASYYDSWGLLGTAPAPSVPSYVFGILSFIDHLFSPIIRVGFYGWSIMNDKILKLG